MPTTTQSPQTLAAILQRHPTMRQLLLTIFTLATINSFNQKLEITTLDKSRITTTLVDSTSRANTLTKFNGKQDNSIRKKWTARTYKLSDGRILIEFYDKQAALVDNVEQFHKLERVRFVKNTVDFLKKNISYKIELTYDEVKHIMEIEKPVRLTRYERDLSGWSNFEVYQLNTRQILVFKKSENFEAAAIFPDIKTLASEKSSVQEVEYGSDDDEHLMKILASGDRLSDYDVNDHLIYPKYLKDLIKNHKLSLVEQKVYVSDFFGNLYKSENGYYILVDEVKQKNGAGNKMQILSLRIYDNLEQVREAEKKYKEFKNKPFTSEHFYQKISDEYGQTFPDFIPQLVSS